jgi:hypothetical protein
MDYRPLLVTLSMLPSRALAEVCDKITDLPPEQWPVPFTEEDWHRFTGLCALSSLVLLSTMTRLGWRLNLAMPALLLPLTLLYVPVHAEASKIEELAMREGCLDWTSTPAASATLLISLSVFHFVIGGLHHRFITDRAARLASSAER